MVIKGDESMHPVFTFCLSTVKLTDTQIGTVESRWVAPDLIGQSWMTGRRLWGKRGIRTKSYLKSLFPYDLQDFFIIYLSGVLIRLILPSRPNVKLGHTGCIESWELEHRRAG
jgi:hypothetical protein